MLLEQLSLGQFNHLADAEFSIPHRQLAVGLNPKATFLLGGDGGAMIAAAEILADLTISRRGVLAGQEHRDHARMTDSPRSLFGFKAPVGKCRAAQTARSTSAS